MTESESRTNDSVISLIFSNFGLIFISSLHQAKNLNPKQICDVLIPLKKFGSPLKREFWTSFAKIGPYCIALSHDTDISVATLFDPRMDKSTMTMKSLQIHACFRHSYSSMLPSFLEEQQKESEDQLRSYTAASALQTPRDGGGVKSTTKPQFVEFERVAKQILSGPSLHDVLFPSSLCEHPTFMSAHLVDPFGGNVWETCDNPAQEGSSQWSTSLNNSHSLPTDSILWTSLCDYTTRFLDFAKISISLVLVQSAGVKVLFVSVPLDSVGMRVCLVCFFRADEGVSSIVTPPLLQQPDHSVDILPLKAEDYLPALLLDAVQTTVVQFSNMFCLSPSSLCRDETEITISQKAGFQPNAESGRVSPITSPFPPLVSASSRPPRPTSTTPTPPSLPPHPQSRNGTPTPPVIIRSRPNSSQSQSQEQDLISNELLALVRPASCPPLQSTPIRAGGGFGVPSGGVVTEESGGGGCVPPQRPNSELGFIEGTQPKPPSVPRPPSAPLQRRPSVGGRMYTQQPTTPPPREKQTFLSRVQSSSPSSPNAQKAPQQPAVQPLKLFPVENPRSEPPATSTAEQSLNDAFIHEDNDAQNSVISAPETARNIQISIFDLPPGPLEILTHRRGSSDRVPPIAPNSGGDVLANVPQSGAEQTRQKKKLAIGSIADAL